jgi:hypothetical protein
VSVEQTCNKPIKYTSIFEDVADGSTRRFLALEERLSEIFGLVPKRSWPTTAEICSKQTSDKCGKENNTNKVVCDCWRNRRLAHMKYVQGPPHERLEPHDVDEKAQ